MSKNDTNKIFFPKWMKVLKIIGNAKTPHTTKTLVMEIGSYSFIHDMLTDLERRGFIVMESKGLGSRGEGNELYIYLTSRGRILWKILMEMEMTMGEQM